MKAQPRMHARYMDTRRQDSPDGTETHMNHLPHITVLYLKGCGMALSASIRTPEVQQTKGRLRTTNLKENKTRDTVG